MKRKILFKSFYLILILAVFCSSYVLPLYAEGPMTMAELQKRLLELEKTVAKQQQIISQYELVHDQQAVAIEDADKAHVGKVHARTKKGSIFALPAMPGNLKIGANLTGIVQGSPETKLWGDRNRPEIGGSYQASITITNEFENVDGLALATLRVGQGDGIEDDLTLYSNTDNNAWGFDYLTLSEVWYEQRLFDKKLVVNVGKLDPTVFFDNNRYANSDPTQFLARIFNNSPVIEFPDHSGAVRVGAYPFEWLELGYLVMAGNPNMDNLQSDLFHVGRVILKPRIYDRQGNYRFLAWRNNNDHTRWDDPSDTNQPAYGFSISCDQEITDIFGIFWKFGWQDPDVYNPANTANVYDNALLNRYPDINNFSLEYMWSAGAQLKGTPWGREKDFCGIAVAQAFASEEMKDALSEVSDNRRDAKPEGHLEAYYNYHFNQYLAVSPSVQLIWNPYGGDAEGREVISVYTLRTHVDF
ncbi:MAG: carbohydrate porin [Candidatus Tantalella remota]|nr:carbohydrate porin [Candidatus Tantalella remota]